MRNALQAATLLVALLVAALMSGCDGGGSSTPTTPPVNPGKTLYSIMMYPMMMDEMTSSSDGRAVNLANVKKNTTRGGPGSSYYPTCDFDGQKWSVEQWQYHLIVAPAAEVATRGGYDPNLIPANFSIERDGGANPIGCTEKDTVGLYEPGDYTIRANFFADGVQQKISVVVHVMTYQELSAKVNLQPIVKKVVEGNSSNNYQTTANEVTERTSDYMLAIQTGQKYVSAVKVKGQFESQTRDYEPLYDEVYTNAYVITNDGLAPTSAFTETGWTEFGPGWSFRTPGQYILAINVVKGGKIIATTMEGLEVKAPVTATTLQVTMFDTTVGDMAQIIPNSAGQFYVTAGHSFRIGTGGITWRLIRTEWDVSGELNSLIKTANGFRTTVNGTGYLYVKVTNLDTGEVAEARVTVIVTGATDDGGKG